MLGGKASDPQKEPYEKSVKPKENTTGISLTIKDQVAIWKAMAIWMSDD